MQVQATGKESKNTVLLSKKLLHLSI